MTSRMAPMTSRSMLSSSTMTNRWFISCRVSSSRAPWWMRSHYGRFYLPGFRSRTWLACNAKLQRRLSELAAALDEDYEISFELITTGTLTQAARHDLEAFQKELAKFSENDEFDATIHVIENDELQRRYDYAIEADNPSINYELLLTGVRHMYQEVAGTPVLIATLPLKDCVKLPGIKDGTLFQKNVRQSLGSSNVVNKGIRSTILGDKRSDFFFFHNGITALCSKMRLDGDMLSLWGLSIVNGCQSLNTIPFVQ